MKSKFLYTCFFLSALVASLGWVHKEAKRDDLYAERYEPNWKSLKSYKTPTWFQDAKLGIFIHWGPYSVPAYGSEWYPRLMYQDSVVYNPSGKVESTGSSSIHNYHFQKYGDFKKMGYKDFIPSFTAEKFNAKEWIELFQKAGARYIVPVAEHHDAFAMYHSTFTEWNAVKMGPKKDILGELCAAGKQAGMKVGASSHFAFNWDYYKKKKEYDTSDPKYQGLYGRNHEPYSKIDDEFLQLWWSRTKEIIDNYKPDILWFDFCIDRIEFVPYHPKLAAYYYNKGIEWRKEVVLQNKNFGNFQSFPEGTNVLDLERGKMSGIHKFPWQTDTSIGKNSWCYVANWESKTPNTLVDDLIDIVSKNGNLLLNVGPKADGTIPADQQAVLFEMGDWLNKNGEAIYNTRPWVVFGEGPTAVATGHHTEGKNKELTSADFRFTTNQGNVFIIAMDYSKDGKYKVKSLAKENPNVTKKSIKNIIHLATGKSVTWKQTLEGLSIECEAEGTYACAFKVIF
jgi:alpha-L-fucosidase